MESIVSSIATSPPPRTPPASASSALKALVTLTLLVIAASSAPAQGPQEWIKRIFDPAKIGVTPPPGAAINRKLTVDYLSKTDPPKEIAIYMVPLDQMQATSDHFKSILKVDPATTGDGEFEIRRFDLSNTAGPAKGLVITLAKSQFVDNKVQVTMEYLPPAK